MAEEFRLTLNDADPDDFNGLRDTIISLAGQGYSANYISKATSTNYKKVCKILSSEFQDRCAKRQDIVQALDQSLMWLQLKCAKAIEDSTEPDKKTGKVKVDTKTGELFLKIVDRRGRLHGADQPVQHEVRLEVDTLSEEELLSQLRQAGVQISLPAVIAPPALLEHVEDATYEPASGPDEQERSPEGDTGPAAQGQ